MRIKRLWPPKVYEALIKLDYCTLCPLNQPQANACHEVSLRRQRPKFCQVDFMRNSRVVKVIDKFADSHGPSDAVSSDVE